MRKGLADLENKILEARKIYRAALQDRAACTLRAEPSSIEMQKAQLKVDMARDVYQLLIDELQELATQTMKEKPHGKRKNG